MALNPQILLDDSAENQPHAEFVVVETEIEFLQHDGAERLWARGKVCDLVRSIYTARKIKVKDVISPRSRLRALLGDAADKINANLLARSLEIFEREKPATTAELLFHLTHDEFWTVSPSLEHAARLLTIAFDNDLFDLAEIQRQIWLKADAAQQLKEIYAHSFDQREDFLQTWLFDGATRKQFGEFPLHLSDKHAAYLSDEIGRKLRASNGAAVSEFPRTTLNSKIYAKSTVEYFSHNTVYLTADRIAEVSSLLTSVERARLEKLLPKTALAPLDVAADPQTALRWATEEYLPFRAFQIENEQCEEADRLAASFTDWMLENYPKLTNEDRETSPINLRTFYAVKKLVRENYWVLWVVVDGLNYQNHQKLLQLLGEKSACLRVVDNSPMFAVLPTITKKAKYGLTTGKFGSENTKSDFNPQQEFMANFPDGVYAETEGKNKLLNGLQRDAPTVCYWNHLKIDKIYHEHSNRIFLDHDVRHSLDKLADDINHLISLSGKNMNRIAVVICSDHGQMTSECRKLDVETGEKYAHGRTILDSAGANFGFANSAFVKTNNGETVYLNPTSFRLREPTTIALGSTYFVDLKANAHNGAIGVHGGLYPEEVVVGLAVLMRQSVRKKMTATVSGSGESGRTGTIILKVDNPNSVVINPLALTIENLNTGAQGELVLAKIGGQQTAAFEIPIQQFPAATDDEEFSIKGALRYEYEDGTQEECSISGKLICKSLYAPKNPNLLNRYKK